jgi:hypothetical protein
MASGNLLKFAQAIERLAEEFGIELYDFSDPPIVEKKIGTDAESIDLWNQIRFREKANSGA